MNSEHALPITFIVVMAGVMLAIVLYVFRQQRRRSQVFKQVAGSLANARHVQGNAYEGELDGTVFRYWYVEGSRNSPPSFHLSIAAPGQAAFQLSHESAVHRFFKRIGISVEVQTGDRIFDDRIYVRKRRSRLRARRVRGSPPPRGGLAPAGTRL